MSWVPPSTLEERVKRALIPPRLELARVVRRELRKGEPELGLVPYLVDRSRAAIDVGANRGVWTHVLARHAPQVHAFEPNPKLFSVLEAAAPANAQAHALALSDTDDQGVLRILRHNGGWSNQQATLQVREEDRDFGEVPVSLRRLDGVDVGPVGFVKIDVEGHEHAVLDGARQTIARDRPTLVIEIEERHNGAPIEASLDRVEALGYATFFLRERRLAARAHFDPEADHRAAAGGPGYVFNFIFLPL